MVIITEYGIISFSSFFLQGKERLQRSLRILLGEYIYFSKNICKANPFSFMIKSVFCFKKQEKKLLDYGTMFLKDNIWKEELQRGTCAIRWYKRSRILKGRGLSPLWDVTVPYLNAFFLFSLYGVQQSWVVSHFSSSIFKQRVVHPSPIFIIFNGKSEALAYSGPGVQAARNRASEL